MKPMNGGAFSKASGIIASASIAMTAPAAKERIAGACVSAEPKSRLPKAAEMPTRSGMPIQIVKM